MIRKFLYGLAVLFGVISTIFFLFNVLPGDAASVMLGQRANKDAIEAIHRDLGTDKPLAEQYFNYLNDLSPLSAHNYLDPGSLWYLNPQKYSWVPLVKLGDNKTLVLKWPYLRRSYITRRSVSDILAETLPETAVLAFAAIVIASVVGVLLGVITAVKKNSLVDRSVFFFATVFGMSAPSFLVGLLVAWLFGYALSSYTGLSPSGSLYEMDVWNGDELKLKNLILPAITLGVRPLSIVIQLTRSSLLEVLSQDYIRTARAKGLSFTKIVAKHALKNALNPVVTAISGWLAGLMAGAVFVEKIFSWKGIGNEVVEALNNNDLPVVMGATLVFASIFVVINIIVDIIYGVLDPRVRVNNMNRKKIVAGNWKMNTGLEEALKLVSDIKAGTANGQGGILKVIFPPFPFLKPVIDVLKNDDGFSAGAQNCSEHKQGAYTGEVSAQMIASTGCKYVLVGHSERRTYFKESSEQLVLKIEQALANDLAVIFCFGEHLEERKGGNHLEAVEQQLKEVLQHFPMDKVDQLILAYEPVWAIGTGETATPTQAQEMHAHVRKAVARIFSEPVATEMSILYGGSCNAQNAAELFACPDVDGGLIGGASLKASDFCKIVVSF